MKRLRLSVRFDGQREVPEPRWLLALEALADSLRALADRRRREWERKTYGVVVETRNSGRWLQGKGGWHTADRSNLVEIETGRIVLSMEDSAK